MFPRTLALVFLGVTAWTAPGHATLDNLGSCTGATSCVITTTPPNPVTQDPDDGILLAWNERQNVTLTADLRVDRVFDETASFVEADGSAWKIKAGTIVSSHYLQWDPDGTGTVSTTIALDSQVFAFITADQKLFDSDSVLGLPGLDYNDFTLRGLEPGDTTDFNGPNVDITWTAGSPGDWTRLITAFSPTAAQAPVPPLLLPMCAALAALALLRRSR